MGQQPPSTESRILYLLAGHISHSLTEAEHAELTEWANRSPENQQVLDDMSGADYRMAVLKNQQSFNVEQALLRVKAKPVKRLHLIRYISIAASFLLFCGIGYYFYQQQAEKPVVSAKIMPGGNKAILTLGNGKTIVLDTVRNGQLAVQGSAMISKTAAGHIIYSSGSATSEQVVYNTVSTPNGGLYNLTLSDGSVVWLNAASSVRYPTIFTGSERVVEITGEAYFEVAQNQEKPFKVISRGQTVEVLGTQFNINSYADEVNVLTTLIAGSVKIHAHSFESIKYLKPGQQSVLTERALSVSGASTEKAIAWKNGYFSFNNDDIRSVMRKLSRWYDFDVVYEGNVSSEEYTGSISRYKSIDQVLTMLEYGNSVHFKIEGRKITVLK